MNINQKHLNSKHRSQTVEYSLRAELLIMVNCYCKLHAVNDCILTLGTVVFHFKDAVWMQRVKIAFVSRSKIEYSRAAVCLTHHRFFTITHFETPEIDVLLITDGKQWVLLQERRIDLKHISRFIQRNACLAQNCFSLVWFGEIIFFCQPFY